MEVQAALWSDYKHHCTIKYLIAITPSGAISWLSPGYGGRCTDVYIVRDSGFLDVLEPYSQVMADRGFKIKTDFAMVRCTLCIPPSAAKGRAYFSVQYCTLCAVLIYKRAVLISKMCCIEFWDL